MDVAKNAAGLYVEYRHRATARHKSESLASSSNPKLLSHNPPPRIYTFTNRIQNGRLQGKVVRLHLARTIVMSRNES